ncbi:hypothetical protein [Azospirillum canadense]|uniref:hypothetical protein n=1 Tax=Azospirillum canadense TaxID=403962 RepID=UPI0022261CC5|nr:hypothetical protein [Azospirillum canadense]MCW2239343.1 hypothetical protein [Azospirillum canadense]
MACLSGAAHCSPNRPARKTFGTAARHWAETAFGQAQQYLGLDAELAFRPAHGRGFGLAPADQFGQVGITVTIGRHGLHLLTTPSDNLAPPGSVPQLHG